MIRGVHQAASGPRKLGLAALLGVLAVGCPSSCCRGPTATAVDVVADDGAFVRVKPFSLYVPPGSVPVGTEITLSSSALSFEVEISPDGLDYAEGLPAILFYEHYDDNVPEESALAALDPELGEIRLPGAPDFDLRVGAYGLVFHHSSFGATTSGGTAASGCVGTCIVVRVPLPPQFATTSCDYATFADIVNRTLRRFVDPTIDPTLAVGGITYGVCMPQLDQVTLTKTDVTSGGQPATRVDVTVASHLPEFLHVIYLPDQAFYDCLDRGCDESDRDALRQRDLEHELEHVEVNENASTPFPEHQYSKLFPRGSLPPDDVIKGTFYGDWCEKGRKQTLQAEHEKVPGHSQGGARDMRGVDCHCLQLPGEPLPCPTLCESGVGECRCYKNQFCKCNQQEYESPVACAAQCPVNLACFVDQCGRPPDCGG